VSDSEGKNIPVLISPGNEEGSTAVLSSGEKDSEKSLSASRIQSSSGATPNIIRANCGPIILQKVFAKYGIQVTLEELIKQSNTQFGATRLSEMKRTVIERGLYAEGIKAKFESLAKLIESYDVICHFTENNHYIWMQGIVGKEVKFVDPTWTPLGSERPDQQTMWRHVFEQEWKGVCLVVSDKPLNLLIPRKP